MRLELVRRGGRGAERGTGRARPFGPGRPYPYWPLANAEVMETEPFLRFFRQHPIVGRGPDKEPGNRRNSKASSKQ